MAEFKTDARGLELYGAIVDDRGVEVVVKESSAASGPHCWVFVFDRLNVYRDDPSPHLTPEQARKLAAALTAFADRAPSRWGDAP